LVVGEEDGEGSGDFEGGGRGETAAQGDAGIDDGVEAAGEGEALADGFDGTFGVEGPFGAVFGHGAIDGELDGFAGAQGMEADDGVRAGCGEDGSDAVESHRADEAVVVVGVFADEVDATGGLGEEEGVGIDAGEEGSELAAKDGDIHGEPPIKTALERMIGEEGMIRKMRYMAVRRSGA
jgi:hypothetical protein